MKIAISYRDEGGGKGAFFDHFTVRTMAGVETEIAVQLGQNITIFANYLNHRSAHNEYGLPIDPQLPSTTNDAKNAGFIFIPGYTRDSDTKVLPPHTNRLSFEKELINKARLRGQPVFAVCAGSWTLWESFDGQVKEVTDHNYGGAMPRMSRAEPEVCNNKMIHRVVTTPNSYLSSINNNKSFPVNSVHWKAPDDNLSISPPLLEVSARSQRDDKIAPKSRQQHQMAPDNCVEAFETRFGVPMIGIQWHPEAFNPKEQTAKPHQKIFSFMVACGQTYLKRGRLNQEFSTLLNQSKATFFALEEEASESVKPSRILELKNKGI